MTCGLSLPKHSFLEACSRFRAASIVADQAAAQSLVPGAYNWTGFYIGLNAGGYFGDDDGGDDNFCGPFYNLIGEGGGSVDFDSVDDIGCVFAEADGGPNDRR